MTEILTTNSDSVRATFLESPRWQTSLKNAVRSGDQLLRELGLGSLEVSDSGSRQFPVFVTREYLSRMQPGDPNDPLLRQVFPFADESIETDGYSADPLHEADAHRADGLLQKYDGRALLVTTGACAIHCRYCFRRHFPYESVPKHVDQWRDAIDQLHADDSISEVILSGGDPLMLVDRLLARLVAKLREIPHVRRLRVHTRLPIVLPNRITNQLLDILRPEDVDSSNDIATWMVVHTNHPAEIDASVRQGLAKLIDHGIPVLNQSVLLRGVNDNLDTMVRLSQQLVNMRVMPYYLHLLDRVQSAAHFLVPESEGVRLVQQMRERLPGFGVPRLVVEQAGEPSKTLIY